MGRAGMPVLIPLQPTVRMMRGLTPPGVGTPAQVRPTWPRLTLERSLTVLDSWFQHHFERFRRRSDAAGINDEGLRVVFGAVADALADLENQLEHLAAATGTGARAMTTRPVSSLEHVRRSGPAVGESVMATAGAVGQIAVALAGAVARLDRIEAALAEAMPPGALPTPDRPPVPAVEPVGKLGSAVDSAPGRKGSFQPSGTPGGPGDPVEARGRTAAEARTRALDRLGVDDCDAEVEIVRTLMRRPRRRFLARAWHAGSRATQVED